MRAAHAPRRASCRPPKRLTLTPPRRFSAAAPPDAIPPDWRLLPRVAFSDFVHAIDAKEATSVEVWADRDPSVYWPPQPIHQPFVGKRCVATLADGSRVWAEAPIPEMEVRARARLRRGAASRLTDVRPPWVRRRRRL